MLSALKHHQKGVTLIELMIGSAIGLVILAAGTTVYVSTIKSSAHNVQMTRLNQEMRAGIRLIARDVRRAGYFGGVPGIDSFTNNPFNAGANDITVGAYAAEAANTCITYSFDRDQDTVVDTGLVDTDGDGVIDADDMEQFGFRLRNQRIEMRNSGVNFDCTADDGWERITDPAFRVTQLDFAMTETCLNVSDGTVGCPCTSGDPCQHMRDVGITIAAERAADSQIRFRTTETVQIRNHKFVVSAP